MPNEGELVAARRRQRNLTAASKVGQMCVSQTKWYEAKQQQSSNANFAAQRKKKEEKHSENSYPFESGHSVWTVGSGQTRKR